MVNFLKKTCVFTILLAVLAVTPVAATPATPDFDVTSWFELVLDELAASVTAAADFVLGDSNEAPAAAESQSDGSDEGSTGEDGTPEFGAGADPFG